MDISPINEENISNTYKTPKKYISFFFSFSFRDFYP